MNYFISDLHLGHANCLRFDNRPFNSIEEQDETIIKNWNDKVTDNDDVYILGDISWYNPTKTAEIFSQLKGRLHLIRGNHDKISGKAAHFTGSKDFSLLEESSKLCLDDVNSTKQLRNKELRDCFCEISDYKELYLDGRTGIVLCHYPIPCFKNHFYGWSHLYGHVHAGDEDKYMDEVKQEMVKRLDKPCNMYNVGCMKPYINYTPRSLDEIVRGYDLTKIEECSMQPLFE